MSLDSDKDDSREKQKKKIIKNINGKNYYMNYFMK